MQVWESYTDRVGYDERDHRLGMPKVAATGELQVDINGRTSPFDQGHSSTHILNQQSPPGRRRRRRMKLWVIKTVDYKPVNTPA